MASEGSGHALIPVDQIQTMAVAVAKSGLFGMKTPEQAMALMLIAQAEGLHPAIAARDYHIIQGRPAKTAEAMLRSFLSAGGKVEWHKLADDGADATFSHPQGGTVRIGWDAARAKAAGLLGKDMFTKYPRQMYRSRTVSEGVRTVCPGATSGMHVPEEVQFFEPVKNVEAEFVKPTRAPEEPLIEKAKEVFHAEEVAPWDGPVPEQKDSGDPENVGLIENVEVKEGSGKKGKWKRYGVKIAGVVYGTFDTDVGEYAMEAWKAGKKVEYVTAERKSGEKVFHDLIELMAAKRTVEELNL